MNKARDNMKNFNAYSIIDNKKNGQKLSKAEIEWFIEKFLKNEIHDYQMSALLMAMFIQGMDKDETAYLTDVMLNSGEIFKFKDPTVVDKHSTGGIGDKASFIVAPIAAACGVKVPMIAGRGLGFTGGTVDKIEAIKGFNTSLSNAEFKKRLLKNGIVLMGQTPTIAPADKRIYALRDVTATIDSIPLITASIMSKKLAEGANGIVMDIKVGSGAFMKDKKNALALAKSIMATAKRFNKKSCALLTNMDQPLGCAVGHSLEIIESIETLKGKGPADLNEVSFELAAHMIYLAGLAKTPKEAMKKVQTSLQDGSALKKFREMIKNQGGDDSVVDNYAKLPLAKSKTEVLATQSGYIKMFENDLIGLACTEIGGGRKTKEDIIDFSVGFYFHKKIGDKVKKGESILTIYHHPEQKNKVQQVTKQFQKNIIKIDAKKVSKPKTIIDIVDMKKAK
jgi:pyrimidine-nucleoside phosphorylase